MGRPASPPAMSLSAAVVMAGILVYCSSGCEAAKPHALNLFSQSLVLVTPPPLLLPYRNGPLLSGEKPLDVYVVWYGSFSVAQRGIIGDFLQSFAAAAPKNASAGTAASHAVAAWWSTTTGYRDSFGAAVKGTVRLAGEASDPKWSLGKKLKPVALEQLIVRLITAGKFPSDSKAVYLVLTDADVYVDGFCLDSCGFHAYTFPTASTADKMLPYAWVGNSATQCPGQCAWPFANAQYGPQSTPLRPPNGDVGVDGMLINMATVLAGAATNPFGTGYYQGDAADPLEAVSACTGIFGKGAFPGYPGELLIHSSGASFNAHGVNDRRFLVPAMWNPASLNCVPL